MKRAQSLMEVVVVIACIIAGILLMQGYFSRSFSGRIKNLADSGLDTQFDPDGKFSYNSTQRSDIAYSIKYVSQTNDIGVVKVYPINYQVVGPMAHPQILETAAETNSRKPMTSVSTTHVEVENKELSK